MVVKEYIESGILETYVMGAASEAEVKELLYLKSRYPEINLALKELEEDMERIAQNMAMIPPPAVWDRIDEEINDLIIAPDVAPEIFKKKTEPKTEKPGQQYIEVESESTHMKIHKNWRWVFAAVFVLGKIFLGFAIYFYLENRQAQERIQELKTEVRQLRK